MAENRKDVKLAAEDVNRSEAPNASFPFLRMPTGICSAGMQRKYAAQVCAGHPQYDGAQRFPGNRKPIALFPVGVDRKGVNGLLYIRRTVSIREGMRLCENVFWALLWQSACFRGLLRQVSITSGLFPI